MLSAFHDAGKMKVHRTSLLRRYGFGVPSIDRALRSANDAVTLIAQSRIHPFDDGKTREMHIHELPWPTSVLEDLGETEVELRVTLSYFIDPHPARRGWEKRHQYQSHGLRFDVKRPNEDLEDLRKRLNKQALGEGEAKSKAPMDPGWFFGARARKYGSLHSDVWRGTAAELAARGAIAVYPVSGWWKEQPKRDRSRHGAPYALVVSIETPRIQADLWTPIAQEVNAMVTVAR